MLSWPSDIASIIVAKNNFHRHCAVMEYAANLGVWRDSQLSAVCVPGRKCPAKHHIMEESRWCESLAFAYGLHIDTGNCTYGYIKVTGHIQRNVDATPISQ